MAMNPVEHRHGGGNHQHIGHAGTIGRDAPPVQKVGLIAARGGLVGSEDELLPLQPRPTRLKSFVLPQIVSLSRSVILLFLLNHYLGKICSVLDPGIILMLNYIGLKFSLICSYPKLSLIFGYIFGYIMDALKHILRIQ